ncbi:MAG: hypothetical protein E7080_01595 [Bacteroidales bacterium]|nr:hypothetical protein [Bacteroidales bacterium]
MKKFNYILGALVAGAMTFTSCNLNNSPKFNDADAFVAFTKTAISVDETAGSAEVPVLLTSIEGYYGTIAISVDPSSTAKEGLHYKIKEGASMSFTPEKKSNVLKIEIIDNAEFTGDVKLVLNIGTVIGTFNKGKNTQCTITIVDDEHPLGYLLGDYKLQSESNFGGAVEDIVTLYKDENDINTVWIGNMVPGATSEKVYGIVNEDKTIISIPVDQTIAKSSTYPTILLHGFYGEDGTAIPTGGTIDAEIIEEDGQIYIVIRDFYGSHVFDANGAELGWFELLLGSVWTKQ